MNLSQFIRHRLGKFYGISKIQIRRKLNLIWKESLIHVDGIAIPKVTEERSSSAPDQYLRYCLRKLQVSEARYRRTHE